MNKAVLITGGAKGIGAACVKAFCENGYNTAFTYNTSESEAQSLAQQTGAYCVKADVRSPGEVMSAVESVIARFGAVDVLINNAGIAGQKLFTDITEDDWSDMIDTDLGGVFRVTKAVLGSMISRKSGSIINISSMWGEVGASCEVHYSAAKAGVIGLTKALAKEVGPSGIRVNCISPGVIETEMNAHLSADDLAALKDETPLETIGKPSDIAAAALYLAGDSSAFITGQVLSVNGGFVIA